MFYHNGVGLRPVERRDLEALRQLRNDPSTWMHLTYVEPITEAMQERWFESLSMAKDKMYWIAHEEIREFPIIAEGAMLGIVRLDEIDRDNRSVRVGCDILAEKRGRGWGTKVYQALLKYCFDHWGMHRLWLCVKDGNDVAIKLYKNAGFQDEGRLRHALWRDGKWVDYIVMGILEDEYRLRHSRTLD